jgi:hypothetical protein
MLNGQVGVEVLTVVVTKRTNYLLRCNAVRSVESQLNLLATCFHAAILLALFDPEDGGDLFLRHVG